MDTNKDLRNNIVEKVLFTALDQSTITHSLNVELITRQICLKMKLHNSLLVQACIAARYHDVGKALIPNEILQKPGKLSASEFSIMKEHAKYGHDILNKIFSPEVTDMVMYHHENVNGTGYYQLTLNEIPLGSRIIHVADVFDALINKRCYKESWTLNEAMNYVLEQSGRMFDPDVVSVFQTIFSS